MKKLIVTILIVLAMTGTALAGQQNLLIMGWDGAGMNNVLPMLQDGKLPNLKRLLDDHWGKLMPVENITATCTVPNWTMFFTGMTPDQTGAYWNEPRTAAKVGWTTVLKADSFGLLRHFKANGYRIGWFVSKEYLGADRDKTPLAKIVEQGADDFEVFHPGAKTDYLVGMKDAALKFIADTPEPWLLFVHTNPDHYGHIYGENSDEYLNEFVRSDALLGELLAVIKLKDTKVLIISDHGFDEGGNKHHNAPDNFAATTLPVSWAYRSKAYHNPEKIQRAYATMRDFYVTILAFYGWEYPVGAVAGQIRGKNLLR